MDIQERKWDDAILGDFFNDRDVQLIEQIPLFSSDIKDRWMWLLDGKKEFCGNDKWTWFLNYFMTKLNEFQKSLAK